MNLFRAFAWKLRPKRRVILHYLDTTYSHEGILTGVHAGHYVLKLASLLQGEDASVPLQGDVMVPCGRVFFLQRLT